MAEKERPETELEKQAREQAKSDLEQFEAFRDMMRTEGWRLFTILLNLQIEGRMKSIFDRPTAGLDDRRGEDFDKGACYALILARDTPQTIIDAHKASRTQDDEETTS